MRALANRRARVARVREVQHLQAVDAASVAEGRLLQLETNDGRLAALRAGLTSPLGITDGATLGHSAELAARLDQARTGLRPQIDSARQAVELRSSERLGARIAQEGADRLQTRAVAAMHREIEERFALVFRPRPKRAEDDV